MTGRSAGAPARHRESRKISIQDKQQREQYAANIEEISREWHALLHRASRDCVQLHLATVLSRHRCSSSQRRTLRDAQVLLPQESLISAGRRDRPDRRDSWVCPRPDAGVATARGDRSRAQHDARSYGAAGRIVDVLAIDDGIQHALPVLAAMKPATSTADNMIESSSWSPGVGSSKGSA